jgi:hypothetical protein
MDLTLAMQLLYHLSHTLVLFTVVIFHIGLTGLGCDPPIHINFLCIWDDKHAPLDLLLVPTKPSILCQELKQHEALNRS